jgi:hypothetical protein
MNMISRDSLAECVFFFLDYWLGGAEEQQFVVCAGNDFSHGDRQAITAKLEHLPNLKCEF